MTASPAPRRTGPLAGLRVFDLSRILAGPTCTQLLGDLGADVIKIERPGAGDDTRKWGPPYLRGKDGDTGESAYYLASNRNKRSVTIDIAKPEGQALAKRLIAQCDIMLENFKAGDMARYGLSHADLKAAHPRLIYCSISGFGQTGPYAPRAGYDMLAQGIGGMMSVTGEPDRPPCKPGPSFGDTVTGMLMAITILGALHERQRTGTGRRLQVAMQDAMLHYMRTCFAVQARTGKAAPRRGGKSVMGANAPSGIYQCRPYGSNDWVYIITSRANPEHWARLMKLIGREELIDDPRFATGEARLRNEAELDAIITEWTRKHTKEEAMTQISGVGVPAGAVFDTMELQNDPSFEKRGIMQVMDHPNGGFKMPAWPVRVDGKPPRVTASPLLGQHNAEVLDAWLGLGADEVAALKREGVL